jgi:oxygen-independent coproporphyrinogen-3 oxidase
LRSEIQLTSDFLEGDLISTVYFGGGTPSLLSAESLNSIVEGIIEFHRFQHDADIEWTLELNPEDVTPAYAASLTKTPFNRFSLGVQSFFNSDLTYLNRSHSGSQAELAVALLLDHGFQSISIDLIFGIPGSNETQWQKNLDTAFSIGVPHVSAYALTVEPRTPLEWLIRKNKYAPVDDSLQVTQFSQLMKKAKEAGFEQYEISNFALPGSHARHNTNYWNRTPYLGVGPSAHSFNRNTRRWNVSNLSEYIRRINRGEEWFESELLTDNQRYNEYVMTSLRTMWGCRKDSMIREFGEEFAAFFASEAVSAISKGWMEEIEGVYYLTDEGKLFADGIASSLFITE